MASKSKSRKPSTKPSALPDGYYTVPARLFDTLLELARGPLKSGTELASTAPRSTIQQGRLRNSSTHTCIRAPAIG